MWYATRQQRVDQPGVCSMEGNEYTSQELDHLGIVAGVCNQIGLIERIDTLVGETGRKVSVGQAVQAMVLNGLGFVSRPLYLTPEFFATKPVDILIHPDLTAADLNEHSLGRALDVLFETGVTEVFAYVAVAAVSEARITPEAVHLDTSSFALHGTYELGPDEDAQAPAAIAITYGYSRDHRPDLKQAVLALMCTHQASLPVWLKVLDGNQADSTAFPGLVQAYIDQLENQAAAPYFIADTALYSAGTLQTLGDEVRWITRVPASIGAVQALYQTLEPAEMKPVLKGAYRVQEVDSTYGGMRQRWLVIFSDRQYKRDRKRLRRHIAQQREEAAKQLRRVCRRCYPSPEAAQAAVETVAETWKFHTAQVEYIQHPRYNRRGRPAQGQAPDYFEWQPVGEIVEDGAAIQAVLRKQGKFVLATNEQAPADSQCLPAEALLTHYKSQATTVERGFRFLKDPLFFAHSLFLKKPARIMALLMVMGLCLLIYALAEHLLRSALRQRGETLPDQKGKPTQNITMRRVFQVFEGIHVLLIRSAPGPPPFDGLRTPLRLVLNLTDLHRRILDLLGPEPKKCYALLE
jgi:transposase